MPAMNLVQAINNALDLKLAQDPDILLFGEDAGLEGGVFRVTQGLQAKYGERRVFDTPLSESVLLGAGLGMAVTGLRPIVEIQFSGFMYPAMNQLVTHVARMRNRSRGVFTVPMTIRMPYGGGIRALELHSESMEAIYGHIPGLQVVIPSCPYDAKGMLISAIEDDDPVIFLEPKRLYNGPFDGDADKPAVAWSKHPKGEVPDGHYTVPLGKADIVRPGSAATIVTYGTMVHVAVAAAESANIDAEIIDLRSLVPLDIDTITASVKRTGRVVIVHEATRTSGFGAELSAQIQEEAFWHLEAPIERVTGWDTPYPHAFEWQYFPSQKRIIDALNRTLGV
ncbi:MAG: alpha-ketoacid dehydrogenase subunit beta [Gammaproteobacteria bacterium]|nr:alpha-ketoacid dehydrogenase subunit beta [Gammaproteobacteria bacterium]